MPRTKFFNLKFILYVQAVVLLACAGAQGAPPGPDLTATLRSGRADAGRQNSSWGRAGRFNPGRASFSIKFKDEVSPYSVMTAFVMPGTALHVEVVDQRDSRRHYQLAARGGRKATLGHGHWRWTAPARAGVYPLTVTRTSTGETVRLNAVVLVRYRGSESVNGFNIGRYPPSKGAGLPCCDQPRGLIEVTGETAGLRLTPHFTLGQFLCKQSWRFPLYLIVSERLLLKLELLLERANAAGWRADTFQVLSGYRTPSYNAAIGNTTAYTRHAYGDAADIYIDADRDGTMDDLDGDGSSTKADADLLAALAEDMFAEPWAEPFTGGLGAYGSNEHHGPFIHVDTRGVHARW